MTTQTTDLTVRRSIIVGVSQSRAFEVFTAKFNSWWPREHHIAPVPMAEALIEPGQGGRWFERGTDGSECVWGKVLVWEPPAKLILSWHLSGEFKLETDPAKSSEVEVRFIAEGPAKTRVELEHRHLERHTAAAQLSQGVSDKGGWGDLLQLFAKAV
jgi:uncharacterized protein YndB with AHSA1/START domain